MQARFRAGDRVRVLHLGKAGHIRTPFYVRGMTGEIFEDCGCFLNPEDLSVGNTGGPVVPLYRVRFRLSELWPDYRGSNRDFLSIEIYDHWLESAHKVETAA
jgi:nitrile hydratase beta subunit-like protein